MLETKNSSDRFSVSKESGGALKFNNRSQDSKKVFEKRFFNTPPPKKKKLYNGDSVKKNQKQTDVFFCSPWSFFEGGRLMHVACCREWPKINPRKAHWYRMPNLIVHHWCFTNVITSINSCTITSWNRNCVVWWQAGDCPSVKACGLDGSTSSDGPSGWEEGCYAALLLLHAAGCVIPGASTKTRCAILILPFLPESWTW